MVFSSTLFLLLFLPITLIIYYNPIWKARAFRNFFLQLASILFYARGEPVFVFVLLVSIVLNWRLGFLVDQSRHKKRFLILGCVYNIGLLFLVKYLSFVSDNLGLLLGRSAPGLQIALPIGISFFTFQILSYLLDIYHGKTKAQKNIFHVSLYITMFPQLIAGPIVRYETIADEIISRKENKEDFINGAVRFVYGLGKKVLIANYVGLIADTVFNMTGPKTIMTAWIGAVCYSQQIFFDFSGYSDMAIGLGKMFGFHFSENFNYPYIAGSVTEFWKRWHISLSTWFRDYVYIPLGGNRVKKSRWIFNLLAVWLLTGIWHGANWTFILWGAGYFLLLLAEKLTRFPFKMKRFSHVYTLCAVMLLWVVFRSDHLSDAACYIGNMFGVIGGGYMTISL